MGSEHTAPPMAGRINTAAFVGLLEQIEISAHRRKWDGPPGFYVIYDPSDKQTDDIYGAALPPQAVTGEWPIRRLPYMARMIVRPALLKPRPVHALFRMALNVSQGDPSRRSAFTEMLRQPGLIGLAFQTEAWRRTARDSAELHRPQPAYADLPDSKEVRAVHGIDVTGAHHVAWRESGAKPKSGTPTEVIGAMPESLSVIMAVLTGRPVPELTNVPRGWDWDAQEYRSPGAADESDP